ncbi:MAG: phosphoribosyl-AMP cyclohydrolase, partial [Clostridia bacterium]|nr:phosphoribosyl-AMP cyclohydrolase [Clostridia bacterium]
MINIDELKFDKNGLIPAVVIDTLSKKVLTVAYMNRESLEITLKKGLTCFYSRSRQELWLKGETSGNYQHVVSITADCDMDALLVEVQKDGPACHKGTDSCFTNDVFGSQDEKFNQLKFRHAETARGVVDRFELLVVVIKVDLSV